MATLAKSLTAIRWVGQKENGCLAACVAMLLGRDYETTVQLLYDSGCVPYGAFSDSGPGAHYSEALPVLKAAGWRRDDRNPEVWIVDVWGGLGPLAISRHAVLSFPNGDVFDPGACRRLRIERYHHVGDAAGFKRS